MSGGRFDYIDSRCKSEIFGWDDRCRNVFEDREISELIFDVFDLIKRVIDNAIDEAREELYKTYGVPQTEREGE